MSEQTERDDEYRRDQPLTEEERRAKALAWVRKIRTENQLPTDRPTTA